MEMIGQKNKCVNGQGLFLTHMNDSGAKCFSPNISDETRLTMVGYLGNKIGAARNFGSAIIGHHSRVK